MLERDYQKYLVITLHDLFPGCIVLKNDSSLRQGIPDLSVFFRKHWAVLEVKASADAVEQPNQRYYVELFDSMFFGRFIYPENEEEVLHDLQQAFKSPRNTRLSWC